MTLCACDGIGRHARFRFSCSNACGFESLQAYQKKESEPALNGARFGFFHSYFYKRQRIQVKTKLAPLKLRRQSVG